MQTSDIAMLIFAAFIAAVLIFAWLYIEKEGRRLWDRALKLTKHEWARHGTTRMDEIPWLRRAMRIPTERSDSLNPYSSREDERGTVVLACFSNRSRGGWSMADQGGSICAVRHEAPGAPAFKAMRFGCSFGRDAADSIGTDDYIETREYMIAVSEADRAEAERIIDAVTHYAPLRPDWISTGRDHLVYATIRRATPDILASLHRGVIDMSDTITGRTRDLDGKPDPGAWGTELWNRLVDARCPLRWMRRHTDGAWTITTARPRGLARPYATVHYDPVSRRVTVSEGRPARGRTVASWSGPGEPGAPGFEEVVQAVRRVVG